MARYVAEGRRRPGRHLHRRRARLHPQPGDGPAGRARRTCTEIRRAEMARAARDPRRAARLARLRRLRPARGRPDSRRCPRAASRWSTLEEAAEPLVAADPRVPPARRDHLRRERRLPAPRPHPLPRDLGRGVRRGRRPGALSRTRASRGSRSSSTTRTASPGPGCMAIHEALLGARARVAVRGVAGELDGRPARPGRPGHHPGAVRRLLRRSGTRRCCAHATQIDPTSRWFAVPRDLQREVWPTEDYELVRSLVDTDVAGGRPVRRASMRGSASVGQLSGPAA